MLLGQQGSGKTSLFTSLLQTKSGVKRKCKASFHKDFDDAFVFMPSTPSQSINNSIYETLDADHIFESVTCEIIALVYEMFLQNKGDDKRTILIVDDVQLYLKDVEVEKRLIHIIANMRHLSCCAVILAQTYNKIPNIFVSS